MIQVHLIGEPKIDLDNFLLASSKALGYDPARSADRSSKKLNVYEKFLAALSCFRIPERPIGDMFSESVSLCAHLSFSFLCLTDRETILKSMERTRLRHTIAEDFIGVQLSVVSGSLDMWLDACTECLAPQTDPRLMKLYTQVYLILKSKGVKWKNKFTLNLESGVGL